MTKTTWADRIRNSHQKALALQQEGKSSINDDYIIIDGSCKHSFLIWDEFTVKLSSSTPRCCPRIDLHGFDFDWRHAVKLWVHRSVAHVARDYHREPIEPFVTCYFNSPSGETKEQSIQRVKEDHEMHSVRKIIRLLEGDFGRRFRL